MSSLLSGPSSTDQTERNIWFLCVEIAWAGMLNAAISFNAAYAVRLGASGALVGSLSAVPSLIAILLLIPSARLLESRADRRPWIVGSHLLGRLGYGLLAILPWLLAHHRAEAVVALIIAASIPRTFFEVGWEPQLADVVPEADRIRVFAARNILHGALLAVLTFLGGQWLEAADRLGWARFPLNYQLLYAVGCAGGLVSTAYVYRVKPPQLKRVVRLPEFLRKPLLAEIRTTLAHDRDYRAITINTFVFDTGMWLLEPLYILLFVRELGAGDGWIGLNSTLGSIAGIAGYMLWRRVLRRLGYRSGLLICTPLIACYAILVGMVADLRLILIWGVLMHLVGPGLDLSHLNILLQLCPQERRASYYAIFSTAMNLGACVVPMVGVGLAALFGIRTTLFIGGSLRMAGALLFHVNKIAVREVAIR